MMLLSKIIANFAIAGQVLARHFGKIRSVMRILFVENVGKVRRCLLSILQNFILAVSQMVN